MKEKNQQYLYELTLYLRLKQGSMPSDAIPVVLDIVSAASPLSAEEVFQEMDYRTKHVLRKTQWPATWVMPTQLQYVGIDLVHYEACVSKSHAFDQEDIEKRSFPFFIPSGVEYRNENQSLTRFFTEMLKPYFKFSSVAEVNRVKAELMGKKLTAMLDDPAKLVKFYDVMKLLRV